MIPRPRSVIKLIRDNQCGFYNNTPYVCCQKSIPETSTDAPTSTTSTTTESLPIPDPSQIFEEIEDVSHENFIDQISSHPNYRLLANDICGPIATDRRITSGKKATLNEYPWMALIAYDVGKLKQSQKTI